MNATAHTAQCAQALSAWLALHGLTHYAQPLAKAGFDAPEQLRKVTEKEFESLGVLPGHRAKIRLSLEDSKDFTQPATKPFYEGDVSTWVPFLSSETEILSFESLLHARFDIATASPEKKAFFALVTQ